MKPSDFRKRHPELSGTALAIAYAISEGIGRDAFESWDKVLMGECEPSFVGVDLASDAPTSPGGQQLTTSKVTWFERNTIMTKPFTAARQVPYSSTVGGGLMLLDDTGACVAQLAILGADKERSDAISAELMTRLFPPDFTRAVRDVLHERARLKLVEGYYEEYDDRYVSGELAGAASAYAMSAAAAIRTGQDAPIKAPPPFFMWAAEFWKPTTARRDLIKSTALNLAEIERMDRAEETTK